MGKRMAFNDSRRPSDRFTRSTSLLPSVLRFRGARHYRMSDISDEITHEVYIGEERAIDVTGKRFGLPSVNSHVEMSRRRKAVRYHQFTRVVQTQLSLKRLTARNRGMYVGACQYFCKVHSAREYRNDSLR